MGSIALADPINGTIIDATLVQANNTALETCLNGGIDNNNVSNSAAIAPSKLAGYPSDASKVLKGDGSWGVAAAPTAYHFPPAAVGPSATANALVPMLTQIIPANTLGTNKALQARLQGDFLLSGVGGTARLQIVFGGVTIYDDLTASLGTSSTRRPFFIEFTLANTDATHQHLSGHLRIAGATAASTVGLGDLSAQFDALLASFSSNGLTNVDTTVAQTLIVNAALSVSNATVDWRFLYMVAELTA